MGIQLSWFWDVRQAWSQVKNILINLVLTQCTIFTHKLSALRDGRHLFSTCTDSALKGNNWPWLGFYMFHQFRIFILLLNVTKVYNSIKGYHLVHMINSYLKVLKLRKRFHDYSVIVLVLVKSHKFLKVFCSFLRKVTLNDEGKAVRNLEFAGDNFSN